MAKLKILFIDDDESLQILAGAMMNAGMFDVFCADRTAKADAILAKQKMDMIVCDVMMPDEDGLTFCARLRASGNKTPFIILSAVSDPKMISKATTIGATEYLVKPFDIYVLQKKILTMLGKSPASPKPDSKSEKSSGVLGWFRD